MRFDHFLVSLMIGVMFIIGGILIITDQDRLYDRDINETLWENISSTANEIYNEGVGTKGDLQAQEISGDSAEGDLFTGGISAVTNVWNYFRFTVAIIQELGSKIGIPAFIMNLFMVCLLFMIIFSIVYLIFRFQPR